MTAASHGRPGEDRDALSRSGQPPADVSRDPDRLGGYSPNTQADATVHDHLVSESEDIAIHPAADDQGAAGEVEVPAHRAGDRRLVAEEQQVVVHHPFGGDAALRGLPGDHLERFRRRTESAHRGQERRQQQRHGAGAGPADGVRRQGDTDEGHDDDASVGNLKSDLLHVQQGEKAEPEIREHRDGVRHGRFRRRLAHADEETPHGDEAQRERESGGHHPPEFTRDLALPDRVGGRRRPQDVALPAEPFIEPVAGKAAGQVRPRRRRLGPGQLLVDQGEEFQFREVLHVGHHSIPSPASRSRIRRRPRRSSTPTFVRVMPSVSAISW